ncbi:MAG: DUF5615 family PIN-like protein [Nocardioides sp.]
MRLLLDEDVPEPLVPLLRHLLKGHDVLHVADLSWKSKKDVNLFPDAAAKHFDAVLTANLGQFNNPTECDAIKRSKLHHISYELDKGLEGLARASASICAGIRGVIAELEGASGQRIARIHQVSKTSKRFTVTNPAKTPPSNYW